MKFVFRSKVFVAPGYGPNKNLRYDKKREIEQIQYATGIGVRVDVPYGYWFYRILVLP